MAIYTEKYGYISYECEDLIAEVNEDIDILVCTQWLMQYINICQNMM